MSCRLWEEGWKQRYYKNKFDVDATDEDFRRKVVQSYVEGLCWVLRYYYQVTEVTRWVQYCVQTSMSSAVMCSFIFSHVFLFLLRNIFSLVYKAFTSPRC